MSRMDGKSPRVSNSGRPSPRKLPLYSPSSVSPFSFNEDTLKILNTDLEKQNGMIPLNVPLTGGPGRCFSQPQTPSEERRSILQDNFSSRRAPSSPLPSSGGGLSLSRSFGAAPLQSFSVGASHAGTPGSGKTMRDYDDTFREMKKENFNLKLRIFFLEERLGTGKKTSADELANTNLELKVQVETGKQELAEKTALLAEASEALDELERQVASQNSQIKSLEEKLNDPSVGWTPNFELGNVPICKTKRVARSPDVARKPIMSPKFGHKPTFFCGEELKNIAKDTGLEILEEDDEISDMDGKCKEQRAKILQLEDSLTSSKASQEKMSDELKRCQKDLKEMSNRLKESQAERRDFGSQTSDDDHEVRIGNKSLEEQFKTIKSENRKIREQLKLQVQERKLLLKKISMLNEQLGSVSETDQKTIPLSEVRPPTSCADTATQCYIEEEVSTEEGEEREELLEDKNPLSDCSTWNTELPNIADVQLCSSSELLFEYENTKSSNIPPLSEGLTSTLVEHLSQQLEEYKSELSSKLNLISGLQTELADKEEIIKDQMDTITDYREEMQRMEDNTFETSYCPVMENKRKARRSSRKTMRRKRRRLETVMCRDRSLESDSWSEPELGVSLARIGLPHSFPELPQDCNCDRNLLSESDDKQRFDVECDSNLCLASGGRVLESLLATLLQEVELISNIDSGIDSGEGGDGVERDEDGVDHFSLCVACTSSIPKELDELLKTSHTGLSSAVLKLEKVRRKLEKLEMKSKQRRVKESEENAKAEETKARLNENYILIAKLSSENLRLLGEHSKLESTLEEYQKSSMEAELRLQDELCALAAKLHDKEKELEKMTLKVVECERKSLELTERLEKLQDRSHQNKMSPDTSSSFDFFPSSGALESFRPRAFSAVSSSPRGSRFDRLERDNKLLEVSSPDLGVDLMMESDMYSSLERGNTNKVGSLAFEKIVQENRSLRREREVLTQKLGKSKSALQETLLRLSKSNMQKQDQVGSPSVSRRGLTPSRSLGGGGGARSATLERELSFNNYFGAKPKQFTSSGPKS